MRNDDTFDVVVIGAGVLGSFHAYFACRRGLRTLLIERGDSPNEASVRNFGTIVPSAMTNDEWHRRGQETVRIYRELAAELPPFLQTGGTQYLALTPGELEVLTEFSRIGPGKGYACRLLDTRQSEAMNASVRADTCLGSLHFPDDLRVHPRGLFEGLIPWMQRSLGLQYLPKTVATSVETDGGDCAVTTAAGSRFRCRHAFVCTGGDFRTLFPRLFAEAGLTRCRLQMMRTRPLATELPTTLASGLSLRWYPSFQMCRSWAKLRDEAVDEELERRGIHILLVQDADGRVVVGDSHEYSEGDFPPGLDTKTEALILREAGRMIRLPEDPVAERWYGIYPLHKDKSVFTTRVGERVHVVTGIGGKGMTTGPALARENVDALE